MDGQTPFWLQKLREKPTADEIWKEGAAEEETKEEPTAEKDMEAVAPDFTTQRAAVAGNPETVTAERPSSVAATASQDSDAVLATSGLMANTCIGSLSPEVSSRLRAAAMARHQLSGTAASAGDTGDEGVLKQNQARMSHEWGDLRIRPPSFALGVCSEVNASSFRGHDNR